MPKTKRSKRSKKKEDVEEMDGEDIEVRNGSEENNDTQSGTETTPSKKSVMEFDIDEFFKKLMLLRYENDKSDESEKEYKELLKYLFEKLNKKYGSDYEELLKYLIIFGLTEKRPALWSGVQKTLKNVSGEGNRNRGRVSYRGGRGRGGHRGGRRSYNGNRGGYRGYNGDREGGFEGRTRFRGRGGDRGRFRGRGGDRGRFGNRGRFREYQQHNEYEIYNQRPDRIDNMTTPEMNS